MPSVIFGVIFNTMNADLTVSTWRTLLVCALIFPLSCLKNVYLVKSKKEIQFALINLFSISAASSFSSVFWSTRLFGEIFFLLQFLGRAILLLLFSKNSNNFVHLNVFNKICQFLIVIKTPTFSCFATLFQLSLKPTSKFSNFEVVEFLQVIS